MTKLEQERIIINKVDEEMAVLFERRMKAVKEIAKFKKENNLPIHDPIREAEVIKKNVEKIQNEELKVYYHDYLEMMMEISKAYQEEVIKK